jgi:hypothetical protein
MRRNTLRYCGLRLYRHELLKASGNRMMKRPSKKDELRTWRVSLFRSRAEHLGRVYAKDRAAAEAAAVEEFKLTDEQRKRLVIQEQL